MDFEEYLWALGDRLTIPFIRERLSRKQPMGAAHQRIMKSFREYMLVGGMPEAVQAFAASKDLGKADFAKQQILALYKNEMAAQKAENAAYVLSVFNEMPAELAKRDKRFRLAHIDPQARLRSYEGAIRWLEEAMVVNLARRIADPSDAFGSPLKAAAFKCLMMDTGLLASAAFADKPFLENALYRAVLLDQLGVNEGMLLENVVAQCLRANGRKAFFYAERDPRTRMPLMEVDFLIREGRKLIPIEVKSGKSKSLGSLTRFREKFGKRIGDGFVLHHGELKEEDGVLFLPYYNMAALL